MAPRITAFHHVQPVFALSVSTCGGTELVWATCTCACKCACSEVPWLAAAAAAATACVGFAARNCVFARNSGGWLLLLLLLLLLWGKVCLDRRCGNVLLRYPLICIPTVAGPMHEVLVGCVNFLVFDDFRPVPSFWKTCGLAFLGPGFHYGRGGSSGGTSTSGLSGS